MKLIITLILFTISNYTFSIDYSRQKIKIIGNVKKEVTYTIEELTKLPQTKFTIYDPYAKNKKITFEGVLLSDLYKLHANESSKKVSVIAINDYKVIIDNSVVKEERMLLALKGDGKYLSVRQKGPARIVIPIKGKLIEGKLAKEGVNWVWFVNTIKYL